MKALLKAGAMVDIQDVYGQTALLVATAENNVEMVMILLQAGADPLIENKDGVNSVEMAKLRGNFELAEELRLAALVLESSA